MQLGRLDAFHRAELSVLSVLVGAEWDAQVGQVWQVAPFVPTDGDRYLTI